MPNPKQNPMKKSVVPKEHYPLRYRTQGGNVEAFKNRAEMVKYREHNPENPLVELLSDEANEAPKKNAA